MGQQITQKAVFTQLSKQLHPQSSINEEQKHEEQAKIPHLKYSKLKSHY